jgi:endoglucanase
MMKKLIGALLVASGLLACAQGNAAALAPYGNGLPLVHMNVAGPGFNDRVLPGRNGYDYAFPASDYLDRWQTRGIRIIRLSVLWERLQPVAEKELNTEYAQGIDKFLSQAAKRNMGVILDIHNYGRYYQKVIGTSDVPLSYYEGFMRRVAHRWKDTPGLVGYDLMNEPYGAADAYWPSVAQVGINGVRASDPAKAIYVEGKSWSNALNWPTLNGELLLLKDPANNLVFSAHMYADVDASGTYQTAIPANFDLDLAVNRVKPFVEWLIRNNRRGQLGEFGVPNDPRYLQAMDRLLTYLHTKCVPMAYWAAGPLWGNYALSIEPDGKVDKPQWAVVGPHVKQANSCH